MRRKRYQPNYWNYLMGNFIDNISEISSANWLLIHW